MAKVFGLISDFQLVKEDASRVVVSYGKTDVDSEHAEWHEVAFYKKQGTPSLAQVKTAIEADIDKRTNEKIISGFVWNEQPVWLSVENQINFSQATVPARFKIGEQADGTPVYHTFETKTALTEFNAAIAAWRQQCLDAGWTEKDGIEYEEYREYFPEKEVGE